MSGSRLDRIEVFSRWVGFRAPSQAAKFTAERRDGDWFWHAGPAETSGQLPPQAVASLVAALERHAVPQLETALFDIPESVVVADYGSIWTNDHPSLLATLSFSCGRRVAIETDSQHAFMLPFKLHDSVTETTVETFDRWDAGPGERMASQAPIPQPVVDLLLAAGATEA